MKKTDSEEYDIDDRGTIWDATVNYYEAGRGGTDEISISLHAPDVGTPQQRYRFRVTDAEDRECVFYKTSVDGQSKPNRVAIIALGKYGWECTNFDVEQVERQEYEKIGPTLQFIDDALAGVLELDDGPVADRPFLLDMLETAQTAVAMTNTLIYPEYTGGGQFDFGDESYLDRLFAEDSRDILRHWLTIECATDAYNTLFMPPLAKAHFGMDITHEEIATVEETASPEYLEAIGINPDKTKGNRPPGFGGVRYADWYRQRHDLD